MRTRSKFKVLFRGWWLLFSITYFLIGFYITLILLSSRLVKRAQNRSSSEQAISLKLSALFGQTIKENGKMQMNGSIIMIDNTRLCRLSLSDKDNGSTIPAEEMKSSLTRLKVDVFRA